MKPTILISALFLLLPNGASGQCFNNNRLVPHQSTRTHDFSHSASSLVVEEPPSFSSSRQDYAAPSDEALEVPADDDPPNDGSTRSNPKPAWHFKRSVTLPGFRGGNDLPFQGRRGCGPVSIAILLDAYGLELGHASYADLAELDPEEDGTSIRQVKKYLGQIFNVTPQHKATISQLVTHLDKGLPALLVVSVDGDPHWCLVTGYQTGRHGEILSWILVDNGIVHGEVSHDEFPALWNVSTAYENFALFIDPRYSFATSFSKTVRLPNLSLPEEVTSEINCISLLACIFQASGLDIHRSALNHIVSDLDPDQDGIATKECVDYLDRFFDVTDQASTSPRALAAQLDTGLPALVVLDTNGRPFWSLVTGYRTDQRGDLASWTVLSKHLGEQDLSNDEFLSAWSGESYQNYSLFITPNETKSLPSFPPPLDLSNIVQLPVAEHRLKSNRDTCGPLAVAALLTALGQPNDELHLEWLSHEIDTENHASSTEKLASFLDRYFDTKRCSKLAPSELKNELDAGRPVLLVVETKSGNHWSTLTGYRTNENGDFLCWDFVQDGRHYRGVSHQEFSSNVDQSFPCFLLGSTSESQLASTLTSVALAGFLYDQKTRGNSRKKSSEVADRKSSYTWSANSTDRQSEATHSGTKTAGPNVKKKRTVKGVFRVLVLGLALAAFSVALAQLTQPKLRTTVRWRSLLTANGE